MSSSNKRSSSGNGKLSPKGIRLLMLAGLAVLLVICWQIGTHADYQTAAPIPETQEAMDQNFPFLALTREDQNTQADRPAQIRLEEYTGECLIEDAGAYLLSGELNGTLRVNAKGSTVHLLFDGVTIHSGSGPAVLIEAAGKVIITLVDGSENNISDSGKYSGREETESCIYSVSDLTINGSGRLTVYGYYKDAIRTKDVLKITDGTIRIQCKRTALHGNDGVNIAGGQIFVESEKNGVKTTRSGEDGKGCLMISGGEISIVAGRYALVTEEADLYILNSTVQLNGVVSDYDIHGKRMIQEGCVA